MTCIEIQEKISAWLDGELTAPESRMLAKHLKTCRLCQNVRQQILAVQKLSLSALSDDTQPEAYWQNLTQRIMSNVPASRPLARPGLAGWIRSRQVPIGRGISLAGAVALLFLVTRLTFYSEPVTKLPPMENSLGTMQAEPVSDKNAKVKDQLFEKKEVVGVADKSGSMPNQQTAAEHKRVHAPNRQRSDVNHPASMADQKAQPVFVSVEKATPTPMKQKSAVPSKGSDTDKVGVAVGGVQTRMAQEQTSPATLSGIDSKASRTGVQAEADKRFVIQTLEQAFASDDSSVVKDAKADQPSLSMSAEQKNHLLIKTAELYFSLVVENKVTSVQQQAIRFFQTHRRVLVDSLGTELYERRLTLLNIKP